MTLLETIRSAFDGDDVPKKNVALRVAYDEIERLMAECADLETRLDYEMHSHEQARDDKT